MFSLLWVYPFLYTETFYLNVFLLVMFPVSVLLHNRDFLYPFFISSLPSRVLCHYHGHRWSLSYCYSSGPTISPPWPWWRQDAEVGECHLILHHYIWLILSLQQAKMSSLWFYKCLSFLHNAVSWYNNIMKRFGVKECYNTEWSVTCSLIHLLQWNYYTF